MLKWKCSECRYLVDAAKPPESCPSCKSKCSFTEATCYTPECGGEQNIDPQLFAGTKASADKPQRAERERSPVSQQGIGEAAAPAGMSYFFNAEEIFHIAIMIEQNGEKFYNHLITLVDDEKTKQVCARLAREEHNHHMLFKKLIAGVVSQKGAMYDLKDVPADDQSYLKSIADTNVFTRSLNPADVTGRIKTASDAVKLALDFEKESILFFIQMKNFTRPEWGQAEINTLVKQEQEHINLLTILLNDM